MQNRRQFQDPLKALPSGVWGGSFDQAVGEMGSQMLRQGVTPQEALGVDAGHLENVYAQAYRLYNTGKYAEAAHLFRLLIMLNALEPKYTLGLAAALHMLKDHYNAIQAYTLHAVLDPRNPVPHYHSADCFMQMNEPLSAMLCLELALERAATQPEYAKLKERALLSLESLRQSVSGAAAATEKGGGAPRGGTDLF